jgi:hypothetical protein
VVSIVTAGAVTPGVAQPPTATLAQATSTVPNPPASQTPGNEPTAAETLTPTAPSVLDALLTAADVQGELSYESADWLRSQVSRSLRFTGRDGRLVLVDQQARVLSTPATDAVLATGHTPLPDMPTFGTRSVVYNPAAGVTNVSFYIDRVLVTLTFFTLEGVPVPLDTLLPLAQLVADRVPAQPEMLPPPARGPLARRGGVTAQLMRLEGDGFVPAQGQNFAPADTLALFVSATDPGLGLGVLVYALDEQAYIMFRANYGVPANAEQNFPITLDGPGGYTADVVVFEELGRFEVVERLALTLAE